MVYSIREASQFPINVSTNVLDNIQNSRVSYRNHYYTSHEEPRSQVWRISKLVQALTLIIFSFGFACFFEQVRILLKQGLTGKEIVTVMVQREHVPITPNEERSFEVLELEKILKNSTEITPFNPKIGEKYFKLCVKYTFLTKENCHLFKNTKILDFSEANFPLDRELIDTLFATCKIVDIIKLEGLHGTDFSNLRLSKEEPSVVFNSSLNWIESVRYLIHKNRESNHRFWLKIDNFPMELICFMSSQEITRLYEILNAQNGKLARTWINNLSQEIKNHGPTSDVSKKLIQAAESIFKAIPEEDAIAYLMLISEKESDEKLDILAPLILNTLSLKSLQIFLTGIDKSKLAFLARLLSSISSQKDVKIMEAKVRVIMQSLLLKKPAREVLSKLYHYEYLRKILMELIDFDQFKELSEEVKLITSPLDYNIQAIEFCVFLNSILMNNGLREHFQRVRFFLSLFQNHELLESVMKESYNRKEYNAQLSIDLWLFAFVTLIENIAENHSDVSNLSIDDAAVVDWREFARQLSELYVSELCEDFDVIDAFSLIIDSFCRSSFKQTLILSFLTPILAEDQEDDGLIFKAFKALWKYEDFSKLNVEDKAYLSEILLLICSELQLMHLLNSLHVDHCTALIDLIKKDEYKMKLANESIASIFEKFNPKFPSKDKTRTGSIMQFALQSPRKASPLIKSRSQARS